MIDSWKDFYTPPYLCCCQYSGPFDSRSNPDIQSPHAIFLEDLFKGTECILVFRHLPLRQLALGLHPHLN